MHQGRTGNPQYCLLERGGLLVQDILLGCHKETLYCSTSDEVSDTRARVMHCSQTVVLHVGQSNVALAYFPLKPF